MYLIFVFTSVSLILKPQPQPQPRTKLTLSGKSTRSQIGNVVIEIVIAWSSRFISPYITPLVIIQIQYLLHLKSIDKLSSYLGNFQKVRVMIEYVYFCISRFCLNGLCPLKYMTRYCPGCLWPHVLSHNAP